MEYKLCQYEPFWLSASTGSCVRFTRYGYGPQERSEDFEDLQVVIASRYETLSVLRKLEYTLLEPYPSVLLRVCHTCNLISRFSFLSHDACDAGFVRSLLPQMLGGGFLIRYHMWACLCNEGASHIPPAPANMIIALPQCPSLTPQVYTYPQPPPQKTHTLSGAEAGRCVREHSTVFCIWRYLFQQHILNPHVTRELSS